jgi:two-component system, OmpR family, heavy metal sensor histidine kinase CusS
MRSPSISFRLTAWVAAVFLCGFAVFGGLIWFDLSWALSKGRDRTISSRANRLVELLESSNGDTIARLDARFADFQEATPEGRLIQVLNNAGERVLPPANRSAVVVPWPHLNSGDGATFRDIEMNRHPFRVFTRAVSVGGHQLRIFVAGQLDDNHRLLARLSDGLLWTIPPLLVISTLAAYFVARRALSPIDRFIESARLISIGSLSQRLPVPNSRDEMTRLADTCNDMLARLETAVGQITRFTADASHELRSPLSYVRTLAEYALRRPNLDGESREAFREIVTETDAASRLLEDMLTLARADASSVEAVFEEVNLAAAVSAALDKLPSCAETGHRFSIQIERGPLWIRGDAASLTRLAWILIDNAIKYTPPGGHIAVSIAGTEREVSLVVRDSGAGIPAAALPRIFERFFRVDPSRGQTEGVGLGLAIGKWIVECHRGHIVVESEEGVGSTFTATFPRMDVTHSLLSNESFVFSDHI